MRFSPPTTVYGYLSLIIIEKYGPGKGQKRSFADNTCHFPDGGLSPIPFAVLPMLAHLSVSYDGFEKKPFEEREEKAEGLVGSAMSALGV